MPYAIYRVAKLKSVGAISASASHNARTRATPNADQTRTPQNEQLVGFDSRIPTPAALVAAWREATEQAKRKPNAVLAQELFVGVSPEFFSAAPSDEKRRELRLAWQARAVAWLQREFGRNLLSVTLHLDETTPHLAAYVVPLMTAKDGSVWLSGKKLFNPVTLTQQQDRYAQAVADLGLERGVRGSVAEHRSIQSFYGQIQEPAPLLSEATLAALGSSSKEQPQGFFESSSAYTERVVKAANQQTQAVLEAAKKVEALAKDATSARRAEKETRASNQKLSAELSSTKTAFRNLADQVRDIPLADVLVRLGWGEGKREGSSVMWRTGEHAISVTGEKWYDHKAGKGGGKSIDLVMHLMACPFSEAVGWLSGQWSVVQATAAVRVKPLLYVFRVLLTGIWLMRNGEIEANLVTLNESFRLPYISDLVARKLGGLEQSTLDDADVSFYEAEYLRLRAELQVAHDLSILIEQPAEDTRKELNDLLVRLRLSA